MSCAVDLARETHDEAVRAPDGRLQQERARHARARADQVEREPDEGEPVRGAAEESLVGDTRDADQLCLDACNECALGEGRVDSRLWLLLWIHDTHDCDEGVDGIEEGCVAIGLSLQGPYGSLDLKLVEEIGNGTELVVRRCLPQRLFAHSH